jgi:single stranded DNA-binding protein
LIFWRKQAELAEKFLSEKGKLIFVKGKISYRKYTDKEGIERQSTDIVVESFKMLGKKEGSDKNDSFPTDEPKTGAKQEPKANDDIFETQKATEMYEVVEGAQKGKIITVLNQDENGVHFLLDRKELFMSHATFSEFHKKMSPYTPEDLNQKNKPVIVGVDDDDDPLPF